MEKHIREIEITYEVFEQISRIKKALENKGLKYKEEIVLDDIYMKNGKTSEFGPQEGKITDTLIIRYVNENDKKVICKKRNYDNKGTEISTEKSIYEINSIAETEKKLNSLGYIRYLHMIDKNYIYENNDFIVYIQEVKDLGIFIEIESKKVDNEEQSIETLTEFAKTLGLKVGLDFNIRKAELLYKKQNNI